MRGFIPGLPACRLFAGIRAEEIEKLLGCLQGRLRKFKKASWLFMEGDGISTLGIVIRGAVHLVSDDFWGNRTIIARIGPLEIFAESFACGSGRLPMSAVAAQDCEVLYIRAGKISAVCPHACPFHTKVLNNLIAELAEKNMGLMTKILHITQRSTREKLISYLSARAREAESASFEIPFNREELAQYLSVDRSAMSAELARMKRDGLLLYRKNRFTLLKTGEGRGPVTTA